VKKSAIIVASALYELSMRDAMLPRFAAADMPAPPPAEGETAPARPAAAGAGASATTNRSNNNQ
jgi:hypothetical protein